MKRLLLTAALVALSSCGGEQPPDRSRMRDAPSAQGQAVTRVCGGGSTVEGIDVSKYQGTVDWNQVAGSGVKFAIARISDGLNYPDAYFQANWSGMKQAGLVRGAYQFFEPSQSVTDQANMVIQAVGQLGPGDLPVAMDVEWPPGASSSAGTVAQVQQWIDLVYQGTGKMPMIYTAASYWDVHYTATDFNYPGLDLWVANYTTNACPSVPDGWVNLNWKFWQYSDGQTPTVLPDVPGAGSVDHSVFNGTLADLQAYAAAGGSSCSGVADGYYCGGNQVTGDANTLYQCSAGALSVVQPCAGWCASATGGDFCVRPHRAPSGADVDGDGKADVCARGPSGVSCWTGGASSFGGPLNGPGLSDTNGWSSWKYYPSIQLADVDGDGKADLCARAAAGVQCWKATGSGFSTTATTTLSATSDSSGWSDPKYGTTLQFADVDGDGKADACGRAAAGWTCWLSDGSGFPTAVTAPDMGDSQGWDQVMYYSTIQLADVDGDGKADVCGRGWGGVKCWLSSGSGFTDPGQPYVSAFSHANGGDDPSVYSTIQLADIDGDGKADVCGRTASGYQCFLSDGTGGFPTAVTGPTLSDASGWNLPQYYSTIQLADVNGDGKADVCGRGSAGITCWLSNGTSFPTQVTGPGLNDTNGWEAAKYDTTIQFADIDGDGKADVCGRAAAGWMCWLSQGTSFGTTAVNGPALSNASGWDHPEYFETIRLTGPTIGHPAATTTTTSGSTSSSTSTTGTSGTSTSGTTGTSGSHSSASGTTTGGSSAGATTSGTAGTAGTTGSAGSSSTSGSTGGIGASTGSTGSHASSSSGSAGLAKSSTKSGCGCSPASGADPLAALLFGAGLLGLRGLKPGAKRRQAR